MSYRIIDLKQQIIAISSISSVESIYIFGSRAYKTGSTRSDVDLLVYSPNEEIDADLKEIFDGEQALDLFISKTLKDARSVINNSYLYKENLISVLDAILLWSKNGGIEQSAIDALGTIRVEQEVDFKYTRFPSPPDPNEEAFYNCFGHNVAFIIMPFGKKTSKAYKIVKDFFEKKSIKVVRADEKNFTGEVWSNVKLYMDCCKYGIALFNQFLRTDKTGEVFNPNVVLEVGYMLAQGKSVCILKDKSLKNFISDLIPKYYYEYSKRKMGETINNKLQEWIDNENIPC